MTSVAIPMHTVGAALPKPTTSRSSLAARPDHRPDYAATQLGGESVGARNAGVIGPKKLGIDPALKAIALYLNPVPFTF